MIKKLVLPLLMFSASCSIATKDDKPFVTISQRQVKDFFVGFTIGLAHGAVKRLFEYKVYETKEKCDDNRLMKLKDLKSYGAVTIGTFLVANKIESEYKGNDQINYALFSGRLIGQFLAESIKPRHDQFDGELKFKPSVSIDAVFSIIKEIINHEKFSFKKSK